MAGGGEGNCLTPWDVQSKRIYPEEACSPTLSSGTGEGMNIQPSVLQAQSIDYKQTPKVSDEISHTLTHEGSGGIHSAVLHSAGFKYHQGSGAGNIGYEQEQSPTLTADYHQPAIVIQTGHTSSNGSGINTEDVSYTVSTSTDQAVAFAQNTRDEVRLVGGDGQVTGALAASPGAKQQSYVAQLVADRLSAMMWRGTCDTCGTTVYVSGNRLGIEEVNEYATCPACARSRLEWERIGPRAMTQYGDEIAGTLTARADSSPCVDRGQNVVCQGFSGGSGGNTGMAVSDDCSPAMTASQPVDVLCMASGQANAEVTQDGTSPTITCLHERPIVCMADDNAHSAIDENVCGTLKVGGGSR